MEKLQKNDIQDVATYCGLVLLKEGMTVSPLKLQKMLKTPTTRFPSTTCIRSTRHATRRTGKRRRGNR